jgi:hypothetical protein
MTSGAAGAPAGLMLKFVPMAASWLPSSQTPALPKAQLCGSLLNVALGNALNAALPPACRFDEKCPQFRASG